MSFAVIDESKLSSRPEAVLFAAIAALVWVIAMFRLDSVFSGRKKSKSTEAPPKRRVRVIEVPLDDAEDHTKHS